MHSTDVSNVSPEDSEAQPAAWHHSWVDSTRPDGIEQVRKTCYRWLRTCLVEVDVIAQHAIGNSQGCQYSRLADSRGSAATLHW